MSDLRSSIEGTKVQAVWMVCETHLTEIAKLFKPGAMLTLLVRVPGNDEADFLLTIDDLSQVKLAIERALNRDESRR